MNEVLPKPDRLNRTKNCELAALLVTLDFTPVDRQMTLATGQGVPGGSLGYWRFLPEHPAGRYSLRAVLKHGLNERQALQPGAYREQAYIAAAFHNYRLLIEQLMHGTRLRLERCGYVYIFQRVEAMAMPEECSAAELRSFLGTGTRNTELAAALATLGFNPAGAEGAGVRIAHECRGHVWMLPDRSADGRWSLQERMHRWADDAWCGQPENVDPIACMADAFYNLRQLRLGLKHAQVYVRVQNGSRSVLVRRDASKRVLDAAERFLND